MDDPYEAISEEARKCTRCHNDPRLMKLLEQGKFRYCWKPFRLPVSAPVGPDRYEFVFIGMEPVSTGLPPEGTEPQPGGFSEPLRFSIQQFLIEDGRSPTYLITNIARCSLPVKEARETRDFRYSTCASFLKREIRSAGPNARLVSIGSEPRRFIEAHRNDLYEGVRQHLHCVTHYANAANPHFAGFAAGHRTEYQALKRAYGEPYRQFLVSEGSNDAARRSGSDHDMRRVFKYRQELQALRDCATCRRR